MHLHGNQFVVTGTEAGRAPESTWRRENTVLVGVAQARNIEFDAKYPGDWMLHCHLPHHMMNSMSDLLLNGAVVQDRMVMTAATNDPQALSQMQTLAKTVGFEHVHHAPIANDASSVPGFPQDAFMDMGMDEAVAKAGDVRSGKELERQHDGHDDASAGFACGKIRRDHRAETERDEKPNRRMPELQNTGTNEVALCNRGSTGETVMKSIAKFLLLIASCIYGAGPSNVTSPGA